MRRVRLIILAILVLAITSPGVAWGVGNIHLGKTKIYPYLNVKGLYTTNVFASAENYEDDFIASYVPGIRFELPIRKHTILLDYNLVNTKHDEYDSENTTSHNGHLFMNFNIGSSFSLAIKNKYKKAHEPRGSSATGDIEQYKTNDASVTITQKMAEIAKLQVLYSHVIWDYKNPANAFREREVDTLAAYFYFTLLPKTSIFLEYDRSEVDYYSTDLTAPVGAQSYDSRNQRAYLGFTWKMSGKSAGTIKTGYQWRQYFLDTVGKYNTWVASIDLNHDFSKTSSLKIVGERVINETSLFSTRFFVSTGYHIEFNQKFGRQFKGTLRAGGVEDTFSDPDPTAALLEKRKDRRSQLGASFAYLMNETISFAFDYDYYYRDSNVDVNDYIDNRYQLSINFKM
ncbi:MAG: outer membrane beta-barrel protein [Deltaproteobacteria bacterium]|nr:outer membrane beta-barrel protein [Deltaproteobacteria bacterium]